MRLERPEERFEEIYEIYRKSFPNDERRTYERQREMIQEGRCCFRIIEEEGKVQAFLEYWNLDSCLFVEYLATAPEQRNKGYGRHLMKECLEEARACGKPVFLEVEPVTEKDPMTERRAGFYRRQGFCLNHFSYRQPPLKEGDGWKELLIMSYGVQIEEKEFRKYKEEIYSKVYQMEMIP
ncbi:GNAT family N-acetyltransferase [Lachnospiraceae bacterium 62-35]